MASNGQCQTISSPRLPLPPRNLIPNRCRSRSQLRMRRELAHTLRLGVNSPRPLNPTRHFALGTGRSTNLRATPPRACGCARRLFTWPGRTPVARKTATAPRTRGPSCARRLKAEPGCHRVGDSWRGQIGRRAQCKEDGEKAWLVVAANHRTQPQGPRATKADRCGAAHVTARRTIEQESRKRGL